MAAFSKKATAWLALVIGVVLAVVWHFGDRFKPQETVVTSRSWFRDVTQESGLKFVHHAGGKDFFMPRQMGSGVALFDFDNDGRLDVYLLQNGGPESKHTNALFRQLPDGTFQDVSKGSGLDINGYNM